MLLLILLLLSIKINKVKRELPFIANLATTTALNAKINKVENKIPNINDLATTAAFIALENKISDVSNLVKKTDYHTKFRENKKKLLLIMIMINILLLKYLIS